MRAYCPRHFVIRTTGLYGVAGASGKGGNFVETMIRLGKAGPVRVVDDQVMTPTATADLAGAVAALLRREASTASPYGLYHITSGGQCSWYLFAKTIFELCGMNVDLSPITTARVGLEGAAAGLLGARPRQVDGRRLRRAAAVARGAGRLPARQGPRRRCVSGGR